MKKGEVHFPLYLRKDCIEEQVETIGLAFNRYNTQFICKKKTFRCFCVALEKNRIISIGVNKSKTHPKFKIYADNELMSIHAEIDMILNIKETEEFNNVTDIYVVRGYSKILASHPCSICSEYLVDRFRSETMLHFFNGDYWGTKLLEDLN